MNKKRWWRLLALLFAFSMVAAACGDDDDEDDEDVEQEDGAADEGADEGAEDEGEGEGEGETIEVTAVDFAYEGLPGTVSAGSSFSLSNESEGELHEFVAVLLPDDEERSVEELLQLPQEELEALFPNVSDVILALPGQTDVPGAVEGDGVLDEPGRYAIICAIPTGIDPQVYLDAAAEAQGGPPEVEGGGPPHFTQGMFAEVVVE